MGDDLAFLEGLEGLEGDDIGNADELGDEELGRRVRRRIAAKRRMTPPNVEGRRDRIARKRVPIGMGGFTFTSATPTVFTFIVEPQRDYQGERIILNEAKFGASTAAISAVVTSIKCGDVEQLPASLGVPVEAFFRDAVGAGLDLTLVKGGTQFTLVIAISAAPAIGDTIRYTSGAYGEVLAA